MAGDADSAWPDVPAGTRWIMQAIRGKDTKPEMSVRRLVHAMGYRYRLHREGLPGRPDLTFAGRRAVIEVRGCFWHQHPGCSFAKPPKTRTAYWHPKLARNVERDAANTQALEKAGWRVLTVWECELGDLRVRADRIIRFLEQGRAEEESNDTGPADILRQAVRA